MMIIGINIEDEASRQEYLNLIKLAAQEIRTQHNARLAVIAWRRMKKIQQQQEERNGTNNTRQHNNNGESILYTEDLCGVHVDNNSDIYDAQIYDAKKSPYAAQARIAKCSKTGIWYIAEAKSNQISSIREACGRIPANAQTGSQYQDNKYEKENTNLEQKVDLLSMHETELRNYHRKYN